MRARIPVGLVALILTLLGCTSHPSGRELGTVSPSAGAAVVRASVPASIGPPPSVQGAIALRAPVLLQLQGSGLHRVTTGIEVASRNFDAPVLVFTQPTPPACITKAQLSLHVMKMPTPLGPLAVYASTVFDTGGDVTRYNGATILSNRPRALAWADPGGWMTWDVTELISSLRADPHNADRRRAVYPLEIRPPRFSPMGQVLPSDSWYFDTAHRLPGSGPVLVVQDC